MFKFDFDPCVIGNKTDKKVIRRLESENLLENTRLMNFRSSSMCLKGRCICSPRNECSEYSAHCKIRLTAKSGITGLWQVSGRRDIF